MESTRERERSHGRDNGAEGGYTLTELLIVIVVMSILATVVLVAVQSLSANAARASCNYDVATVDHAIAVYELQMAARPTSISDLMPVGQVQGANGSMVGPWLHNVPTNGTRYSVVVYPDTTTKRSYAAVVTPGSTTPSVTKGSGTDWNAVVYEPDQNAAPATITAPQIVTSTSAACVNANAT